MLIIAAGGRDTLGPQGLLHRNPRIQTGRNEPTQNSLKQNTVHAALSAKSLSMDRKYIYKQLQ